VAGHSVEYVIDTTSRRDRRGARARRRLDQLISQAGGGRQADTPLPPDQPWLDVSYDARPSRDTDPDWWPDVAPAPPDPEPDPEPPHATERVLLGSPRPAADPWWRRRFDGVVERWLPARAGERRRWWPVVAAVTVAVLVGVAIAIGLVASRSGAEPEVPPALPVASVASGDGGRATGTTSPAAGGSIVVSVVGRVAKPGLVKLRDGARVADALEATGGPARGVRLGGLNLARRLTDGEQIYVGVPTPPNAESPAGASGSGEPGEGPVDLNSASLTSLDTLPGVGPVTAQRIVEWRSAHGRFDSVDQLQDVDGIGPTRFAQLKELVVAR
jgi:competence protein ComEA